MSPTMLFIDTHVAIWLYSGEYDRLKPVKFKLEHSNLLVSPFVILELQYLFEIHRVDEPASAVVEALTHKIGVQILNRSALDLVRAALDLSWTRDPFDRMIVATAFLEKIPLLTADKVILANFSLASWN